MQDGETIFTCAICFDELPESEKIFLPCCSSENSTIQYCAACIRIIAESGHNQGFGRCPTCRTYFRMIDQRTISIVRSPGRCEHCIRCFQIRLISDPVHQLCAPCMLGSQYNLRYQCNRCFGVQRIPHPMWLYQPSPDAFGEVTWACHQGCADYTTWRICPEDVYNIPLDHIPESWSLETWIESIRALRRQTNRRVSASRSSGNATVTPPIDFVNISENSLSSTPQSPPLVQDRTSPPETNDDQNNDDRTTRSSCCIS